MTMKGLRISLLIFTVFLFLSCYVDLDLRTPNSTIETLKSVSTIRNLKEFRMMLDEKHYNPTDAEIKSIMELLSSGYVKIVKTDFILDDTLGNINVVHLFFREKGTGKTEKIKVVIRDIEDLWYIHNIIVGEEEK